MAVVNIKVAAQAAKMLTVTVDGKATQVPVGSTALQALRAAGLDVPTACNDPRLKPVGGCRLCLVRLAGSPRLYSSCALPVTEGMAIEVESGDLHEVRRGALELLARNYPGQYVQEFPEKTFHRWLNHYGIKPSTKPPCETDDSNPYFRFDPEACIKCFNCVRICTEVQGSHVWQIHDRAGETHVAPDSMATLMESTCKSCGACVDACPTGALVDKARIQDGQATTWTKTTCPYCGVGCELNVGTVNGKISQVLPVLESPVSKGHLCIKGRYAHQFVHAPDRLSKPLVRRNGQLVEVEWPEAISEVAARFKRILADHGPDAIGVLGSARIPNEDNYLAQKFARMIVGTNNVDCCARVCHGPTAAAMKVMLGTGAATNSYDDLERTSLIMVVGSNPLDNHPIVGERIRQAVLRGTKLIVIDPRRTEIAGYADVHLALRPGTNVPLLHAMAHVMFDEGLIDAGFLESRVDDVAAFREFLKEWTPERSADMCGLDADSIRQAALLYASCKPAMCFHGLGVTEHVQGTDGVKCLVNLALLTGNLGKPGCGINPLRGQNNVQGSAHMGCEPSNLPGFVSVDEGRERIGQLWNANLPTSKGLRLPDMLSAALDGKLKAMWCIGYDVLLSNPDAHRTREQIAAMDTVVVQDIFLNETARDLAHVVLPASSAFERGGTFMNAERRVQRVRKAVEPVAESKPDWQIIQMVAEEMGHGQGFQFQSEEEIWDEVRLAWRPGAGISYERIEEHGIQWPCPTEDHPGTSILHKETFTSGPRAPLALVEFRPGPEVTTSEYPFILNTGRTLYQFNAATMTGRTENLKFYPTDVLEIHHADAAELGIVDGGEVRLTSRYGSVVLPAAVGRRVRRGELFTTFHDREVFLNFVTSPHVDRTTGTPEYKVTAVRIEPVVS